MRDFCKVAAAILAGLALAAIVAADEPAATSHRMELPPEVRGWFRNPDGSCVQCSIGMVGAWQNCPVATTLLWNTEYGSAVRGGSTPSRVEAYADRRGLRIYNVTGSQTWDWMKWAARTGRFAAIGAGSAHFQTLYGWDERTNRWYVCNNNSTSRVDEYDWNAFQRLHLASGEWCVILNCPVAPRLPVYREWWR